VDGVDQYAGRYDGGLYFPTGAGGEVQAPIIPASILINTIHTKKRLPRIFIVTSFC